MKNLSLLLILIYSISIQSQQSLNETVEQLLMEVPDDGPGVSIGIYQDGKLLLSTAKGLANIGEQIPITAATNFNIASISKQFTAACIMHLHQHEHLQLSDPLSKHLPDFQGKLKDVTIQQLLNHTSGIRDYMSLMMLTESPYIDFFNSFIGDNNDIYELMLSQRGLEFEPGSEHRYSNSNYWILGEIVKSVSGISLGEYANKHLFDPLKMENTSFQENGGRIVPYRAVGHVCECPECEIFEYTHRSGTVGDSGLLTNIEDLLKWENEYYNHEVLNASSWNLMTKKGVLNGGETIDYAAGLIIGEHQGHSMIQHSGQEPGFVTMLVKFPEERLSIAVLANYTWVDAASMAFSIADYLLPKQENNIAAATHQNSPLSALPAIINLPKSQLEKFCGTYLYKETGEIRSIELHNDTLLYVRDNGPSTMLLPLSGNILTYADRMGIKMVFTFTEDGADILWQHPIGDMHASNFVPIVMTEAEANSYTGAFYSNELAKTFSIVSDHGQLFMAFAGQQMPLTPLSKTDFVGMSMFKLRFIIDDHGTTSLFLDAPRAGNIECVKQENIR